MRYFLSIAGLKSEEDEEKNFNSFTLYGHWWSRAGIVRIAQWI